MPTNGTKKKEKLVRVPFKYDKPSSHLIQQLERFNELQEVKVLIKKHKKYITVTGIATGNAWHIIAWLESAGLLNGVDVQMTKSFWTRILKYWKDKGLSK